MRARLVTPQVPGAIAIIQIEGDINSVLERLSIGALRTGERRLTDLCGVDRGLVVRWSPGCLQLMPHGGPAVVAGLLEAIASRGITIGQEEIAWPEAEGEVESMAMNAIAEAASPAAVSRLLAQPARWKDPETELAKGESAAVLDRLLIAPSVVAVGRPNIGKSALCNALAGTHVALVADEAGVTRDHVGVSIRLGDGPGTVVVRWIDTPGISPGGPRDDLDAAAQRAAMGVIRSADAVVSCGDAASGFVEPESLPIGAGVPVIRAGLRSDLAPIVGAGVSTSARTGAGIEELVWALREAVFPAGCMDWPGRWRFDPRLPARGG